VHAAVDRFYAKVLADDRLVGYFPGARVDGLMEHQRVFLTVVLGGPGRYRGRTMRHAHQALHVRPEHFDAVVEHLVATLVELGIPASTIERIGATLLPLKQEIAPEPVMTELV
jgi:hemoglobin